MTDTKAAQLVWKAGVHEGDGIGRVKLAIEILPLAAVPVIVVIVVPLATIYKVGITAAACIGAVWFFLSSIRAKAAGPARLTLDFERRRLYAEHFCIKRRFWRQRRTPLYECGFDDIRWIRVDSCSLVIKCPGGTIGLYDESVDFYEIVDAVRTIAPERSGWTTTETIVLFLMVAPAAVICWACLYFGWV